MHISCDNTVICKEMLSCVAFNVWDRVAFPGGDGRFSHPTLCLMPFVREKRRQKRNFALLLDSSSCLVSAGGHCLALPFGGGWVGEFLQ